MLLFELDEEGQASCQGGSFDDDIGRIIIRRATVDDHAHAMSLINVKTMPKTAKQQSSDRVPAVAPLSIIDPVKEKRNSALKTNEHDHSFK